MKKVGCNAERKKSNVQQNDSNIKVVRNQTNEVTKATKPNERTIAIIGEGCGHVCIKKKTEK